MTVWPKNRPPLPSQYQAVYEQHMNINRTGGSGLNKLALKFEEWMHRAVAHPPAADVLELGAGSLNHLRWESHASRYDVIEPLEALVHEAQGSQTRATTYLGSYPELVAAAGKGPAVYDKVVSVAVLEHLEDVPAVVAASAVLLREGGTFAAGIPSEGGALWSAAWRTTTGPAFRRRYGLDYGVLMTWEHINTAQEIERIVQSIFRRVEVRRWPGPTLNTSLYTCLRATSPRREVAKSILAQR